MKTPKLLALLAALLLTASASSQTTRERCGTPPRKDVPSNMIAPSDCGYSTNSPSSQYDPTFIYEIPVVFHVMQNTSGTGYLSPQKIQEQIDILNEDFQALPGSNGAPGTNGQIRFRLATTDPQGNQTNGITYTTNNSWFNDVGNYYDTLAWDTHNYLNIYSNSAGGYLGYVPDIPQGGIVGQNLDRVVVAYDAVGYVSGPYNLGRTATHEVGHYLGLYHTFDGGCGSTSNCYGTGDLICDTNRQSSPTFGCPGSRSSCSSSDPFHNYMDYSDDVCMNQFTPEQVNRMRCTLENWRPDLAEMPLGQEVVRLGSPANPNAFRPGQSRPPTAGQIWDPMVDHSTFMPGAVSDMILISLNSDNVFVSPYGTLLCQQPFLRTFTNSSPGNPFSLAIPANTAGITFSAQAVSTDASGQMLLTNALDCTIGN
ncbi:MAG: zinc metalloprotease [Planctomycetes bacterium]|nr:zinc metalloprotease [Planctomycetota bacterium]